MTKTALITGASSGIGRGIAHKFGQEGWEITLVARREKNLKNVAKEVEEFGGKVHIFATDLTEKESPGNAVKFAIEKMGKSNRHKYRAIFYYLCSEKVGKFPS